MRRSVTALVLLVLAAAPAGGDDVLSRVRVELEVLKTNAGLSANADGLGESARFARFAELWLDYTLADSPELATFLGRDEGQDRWSDESLRGTARRDRDTQKARDVLRGIDRAKLGDDEALDYDLLLGQLEDEVQGQRFARRLLALDQLDGVHVRVPYQLAMMPRRTVSDFEAILARLAGVPALVEATVERLAKGIETGVVAPRTTVVDVPAAIAALVPKDPLGSPLLAAFREPPQGLAEGEAERLRAKAVALYTSAVKPAYDTLRDYLREFYLPAARESIALSALPDGKAWYAYRVRLATSTDLDPEAIHALGLEEVERLRGELEKAKSATSFAGNLNELLGEMRTDRRFFFDDPEEMVAAYRTILKRADGALPRFFRRLPRLPYAVVAAPPYTTRSGPAATYEPGSLEAARPGRVYVNTSNLGSWPSWQMEALALHEGVPGHHLQMALALEEGELPWFRRLAYYPAFSEGWALYAEGLGEEMGFYQDPYAKLGQLQNEMWRAVRLVVDTGIHAQGWGREQAIDYFLQNTGKSRHEIEVEVDRYVALPGQALAYKIGERKIRELRRRAEEALGEGFDLRAFHDVVLEKGALPLDVLEARVNAWIAAGLNQDASPGLQG